jgi:hypothetical protein
MESRKLNGPKAGGAARAISSRKESIDRYMKNPNICLTCGMVILVQDHQRAGEVRLKKFCNRSCAAIYNNRISPKRVKLDPNRKKEVPCKICGNPHKVPFDSHQKLCSVCQDNRRLETISKGELFLRRKNWQSARSSIRYHAAQVYQKSGKPSVCYICGYSNYVEVAHIRPVSSFKDETTITEINQETNLVALCPNHHWEYDQGILELEAGAGIESVLT